MKKHLLYLIPFILFCLISCKKQKDAVPNDVEKTEATEKVSVSPDVAKGNRLLNKCIAAHGGMNTWKSFNALEYTMDNNGKPVYQITQLRDRRAYLESADFEVGFDGDVAWAFPDAKKVPGESAAFYYDLDFYFVGIPFLLKDPGVNATYNGKATVNQEEYESLKITFGPDVGLTPEDVYYLYIDPETHMLRILTYSVSFFDAQNAKINSAKVYSDYQKVQGLMMPTKMENFEWDADTNEMGASKNHHRLFSDVKFYTNVPKESRFEVPDGAITETVD